jgi:flagellar assembly protein FliH
MRALSEPQATPGASRIIAAEALAEVASYDLNELAGATVRPTRPLSSRDLSNETARAAFELGRKRGYAQGFQDGQRQGFDEGSEALAAFETQKIADIVRRVQPVADGFRAGLASLESDLAADLVTLAIDIARQVLRRELSLDEQALLPAAREALRGVAEGASQLQVHVHPSDAAVLEEHLELVRSGHCKLKPDQALAPGSCRVEADTGVAEAGFAERWQAVMATLGREWEEQP